MAKIEIPGYEIVEKIGEGAMSTVWAARQLSLDRLVAIKILSPELLRDPEELARFNLEAQAAAKLKHPGIVQVYDAGQCQGSAFYVMELVAGCSVGDLLKKQGHLAEKHGLLIAEGVALALDYAWRTARMIHCDIKPYNILIDHDGSVKVADLGLARLIDTPGGDPDAGQICCTPNYCSPEQAVGEADLDCRTDIYALGAMLYHLLTGQLPFGDKKPELVLELQQCGFLSDPLDIMPGVSNGAAWLLEKLLVKDRALRYSAWTDVLADIERVKEGDAPAPPLPPAGKSTVLRSENRKPPQAAAKAPPRKKIVKAQRKAIRAARELGGEVQREIILSRQVKDQLGLTEARGRARELPAAMTQLGLLLVAVVVGYGGFAYYMSTRQVAHTEFEIALNETLPPRTITVMQQTEKGPTIVPATAKTKKSVAGVTVTGSDHDTVKWDNPDFMRGARLFNEALELRAKHMQNRNDTATLPQVEKKCRQAIQAFDACRKMAPAGVDVAKFIQQCYQLIADVRQATLLAPASGPAARAPPAAATGSESAMASSEKTAQMALAATWNTPPSGGELVIAELKKILEDWGTPRTDLVFDKTKLLFGQIYYSMPIKDAAWFLGRTVGTRKRVECPGFPRDSFFYYTYPGDFGEGFNTILLVTDTADRIVAVQLVSERPASSLRLAPQFFNNQSQTYNFIQLRTKDNAGGLVGFRVTPGIGTITIDSEWATDNAGMPGQSKERVSLILPQQVLELVLYTIQQAGK